MLQIQKVFRILVSVENDKLDGVRSLKMIQFKRFKEGEGK